MVNSNLAQCGLNDQTNFEKESITGLDLLRVPFKENQISKLPKPTKAQTEEVRDDFKKGVRCDVCGGWHHPKVVHLDYVGHAAITDRLLDADKEWNWEPISFDAFGLPSTDKNGGMWIKLTVCGVTRLGYGHPDGKHGGDAVKELIGDALRNAAMRFGAALDLWHRGSLHLDDTQELKQQEQQLTTKQISSDVKQITDLKAFASKYAEDIIIANTKEKLDVLVKSNAKEFGILFEKLNDWHVRLTKILDDQRKKVGANA